MTNSDRFRKDLDKIKYQCPECKRVVDVISRNKFYCVQCLEYYRIDGDEFVCIGGKRYPLIDAIVKASSIIHRETGDFSKFDSIIK